MLSRKTTTLLLILSSAVLANVIYYQWSNHAEPVNDLLDVNNESSELEPLEVIQTKSLAGIEGFSSIVERPLFSVDRRPNEATIVEEAPKQAAPSNTKFILTGLMLSEEQDIALIKPIRAAKLTKLTVGESINGWKLTGINKSSVTLKSGIREVTVELTREKHTQPTNTSNHANDMTLRNMDPREPFE